MDFNLDKRVLIEKEFVIKLSGQDNSSNSFDRIHKHYDWIKGLGKIWHKLFWKRDKSGQ